LVLQLLQQRGIFIYWFWNCCDSVVFFVFLSIGFGTVATAWYFLYFFSIGFGTVAKAWYFDLLVFYAFHYIYKIKYYTKAHFCLWFWNCSDGVIF
jgi:hypothetical protein